MYEIRQSSLPLLQYAACRWGHHASFCCLIVYQSLSLKPLTDGQKFGSLMRVFHASNDSDEPSLAELNAASSVSWISIGSSPLHMACFFGLQDLANVLLEKEHAEVDAVDKDAKTPIFVATLKGYDSVVKALLEAKADIHIGDRYDNTPVLAAAGGGHVDILKLLITNNGDIHAEYF